MFKTILVPVDGSRHGDHAVDVAVDLAKHHGSNLLLVHVIRPWSLPKEIIDMIKAGEVNQSRQEIMQQSAEIILESTQRRCQEAGLPATSAETVTGDPATLIEEYAQAKNVDLIIMGHSGLEAGAHPNLLGGVARKLVNISSKSCLIVR
jgi:nucleotide-binding universal stress UspA family protein